jgi:phytol kinase
MGAIYLPRRHPPSVDGRPLISSTLSSLYIHTIPPLLPALIEFLAQSPSRDIAATSFAAVGSLVWVRIFDTLADRDLIDRKLSRKLVHISTGPLFVLTWPLFGAEPYSPLCAALVPALNAVKLMLIGSGVVEDPAAVKAISREGDRTELLRGPLYYCLTMVLATALCWRGSAVGFTALALMCGGDGLADVVGRRLGRGNR